MGLNIGMIRESFELAKPIADRIADRFYINLWGDQPLSKVLFEGVDMAKQKKALVGSLVQIVDSLDQPAKLTSYLQAMGARHLYYGTEEHHYEWVGAALLKTFGEFLGDSWTPVLVEQWTLAYKFIADTMKEGAKNARAKDQEKSKISSAKPVLKKVPDDDQKGDRSDGDKLTIDLPQGLRQKIHDAVQQSVDQYIENEIRLALSNVEKRLESQGLVGAVAKKAS